MESWQQPRSRPRGRIRLRSHTKSVVESTASAAAANPTAQHTTKAPRPAATHGMFRLLRRPFLLPVVLVLLALPRHQAFTARLRQDIHPRGGVSRGRLGEQAATWTWMPPSSTSLCANRVIDTRAVSSPEGKAAAAAATADDDDDEDNSTASTSALAVMTSAVAEKQARLARREARRRRKQQQAAHLDEGEDETAGEGSGKGFMSGGSYMLPALSSSSSSSSGRGSTSSWMQLERPRRRESPPPPPKLGGTAEENGALISDGSLSSSSRPHTVDLYVPSTDLEVMLAWADKLDGLPILSSSSSSSGSSSTSSSSSSSTAFAPSRPHRSRVVQHPQQHQHQQQHLVFLDKEQRLLALAQMVLSMEKLRTELAEARSFDAGRRAKPVTSRELASRLGLSTEEVEAFYKLGLRARSYILMSMHSLILVLARKYAGTFGVDQAELVQEGYRGAVQALERYDRSKAGATGATFRGFAHVYVMSAMITAARNELHLGAAPLELRDPALMRLPRPGEGGIDGGREEGRKRNEFLLPSDVGVGRTRAALPVSAGNGRGDEKGSKQLALAAASSASGLRRLSPELEGEGEEVEEGAWELDDGVVEEEDEEDEEEAAEAACGRKPSPRAGRRRKVQSMRRMVTRMGPAHDAVMEAVSAGRSLARAGPGSSSSSSSLSSSRRAELFGVDPEAARPAYELVDESKRARDLNVFLRRAAAELPARDMQVLSLVYGLEGRVPMKKAQVAEKLGVPVGVVSKSERRALKKLREMLNINDAVE